MYRKLLGLLLYFVICVREETRADLLEDYCWRDFDDVIPKDALVAGKARDGLPIYVGQVLYDNKLIPGKIHHNSSQIHIEFKRAHVLNETIKILCTSHPKKFVWIKTKTNDILSIKNKHIFEGGYEKGVTTYIGRAVSHDELTVGKVICWLGSHCIPLTTVENGRWDDHGEFEILTFDDNAEAEERKMAPKMSKYSTLVEPLEKASPLAIFLLVAVVVAVAAAIILLVRRC